MDYSRSGWNSRWKEKIDHPFEPDPWLTKVGPMLPRRGTALDIASGRGRNALFLAERGLAVTALDISEVALAQLEKETARRSLRVTTKRVDLETDPHLLDGLFDLVIHFFYLHRPLLPRVREVVRPGGIVVLRTFSGAGDFPGGPGNQEIVLRPGELLELFEDWEILLHEEGLELSRKGGSLAGIVARRPLQDSRD